MVKLRGLSRYASLDKEVFHRFVIASDHSDDKRYWSGYWDSIFWTGTKPNSEEEIYLMGWNDAQGDYAHEA